MINVQSLCAPHGSDTENVTIWGPNCEEVGTQLKVVLTVLPGVPLSGSPGVVVAPDGIPAELSRSISVASPSEAETVKFTVEPTVVVIVDPHVGVGAMKAGVKLLGLQLTTRIKKSTAICVFKLRVDTSLSSIIICTGYNPVTTAAQVFYETSPVKLSTVSPGGWVKPPASEEVASLQRKMLEASGSAPGTKNVCGTQAGLALCIRFTIGGTELVGEVFPDVNSTMVDTA